jgi:hypothetical protein
MELGTNGIAIGVLGGRVILHRKSLDLGHENRDSDINTFSSFLEP